MVAVAQHQVWPQDSLYFRNGILGGDTLFESELQSAQGPWVAQEALAEFQRSEHIAVVEVLLDKENPGRVCAALGELWLEQTGLPLFRQIDVQGFKIVFCTDGQLVVHPQAQHSQFAGAFFQRVAPFFDRFADARHHIEPLIYPFDHAEVLFVAILEEGDLFERL